MNKKAKKYSMISGIILSIGFALLLIATITVDSTKILANNTSTGEQATVIMWQGFSFNNASAFNMTIFCSGIILSILGMSAFMFCNIWLTKRLSRSQSKSTFGKKRSFMIISLVFLIIGLIVSFIAGGSWDEYKDPSGDPQGMATAVHRFLAIAMFGVSFILILLQTFLISNTKNIKGKIVITPRKEV